MQYCRNNIYTDSCDTDGYCYYVIDSCWIENYNFINYTALFMNNYCCYFLDAFLYYIMSCMSNKNKFQEVKKVKK